MDRQQKLHTGKGIAHLLLNSNLKQVIFEGWKAAGKLLKMRKKSERDFLKGGKKGYGCLPGFVRRNGVSLIAVPGEGGLISEGKATWFM